MNLQLAMRQYQLIIKKYLSFTVVGSANTATHPNFLLSIQMNRGHIQSNAAKLFFIRFNFSVPHL